MLQIGVFVGFFMLYILFGHVANLCVSVRNIMWFIDAYCKHYFHVKSKFQFLGSFFFCICCSHWFFVAYMQWIFWMICCNQREFDAKIENCTSLLFLKCWDTYVWVIFSHCVTKCWKTVATFKKYEAEVHVATVTCFTLHIHVEERSYGGEATDRYKYLCHKHLELSFYIFGSFF
jgi:hypothetical protein